MAITDEDIATIRRHWSKAPMWDEAINHVSCCADVGLLLAYIEDQEERIKKLVAASEQYDDWGAPY